MVPVPLEGLKHEGKLDEFSLIKDKLVKQNCINCR